MPRTRTVSLRQLDALLKLMESNPEIANSHRAGHGPSVHRQTRRFWAGVADQLNDVPAGTVKRAQQWKSYWHDVKYRARKRATELRLLAARGETAAAGARALSDTECRVLRISGVLEHKEPIPLDELIPGAGRLSSSWVDKSSPAASPSPPPTDAASPPPALDPLCDSEESEDSRTSPHATTQERGRRWSRRPAAERAASEELCRCAQASLTRTQDRISRTQDTIARSQDRIAHTQERIARHQERIASAHDRIAAALETIAPQVDRVPALLAELVQLSKRMFDNEY